MKIMVIGSTGMLGSSVGRYFLNNNIDTTLTYRKESLRYGEKNIKFDILSKSDIHSLFNDYYDYYINCAGSIKQKISQENKEDILINSVFPWKLADMCEKHGSKLIHITTDCVFSGNLGKYSEDFTHDCLDFYGKTKSLGEPSNAMVIRTSIIGEELSGNASLVEWAKSNAQNRVDGYTNHWWNGITTLQYAKICHNIIENNYYKNDKFHIFSPKDICKHDLLGLISERFHLNLTIDPHKNKVSIDRTLRSSKNLVRQLEIPTINQQICEM